MHTSWLGSPELPARRDGAATSPGDGGLPASSAAPRPTLEAQKIVPAEGAAGGQSRSLRSPN